MTDHREPARNAPCPCGSGQRFKACHGALASRDPLTDALSRARSALAANDTAKARLACAESLALQPEHPEALVMLAQCEQHASQLPAALAFLLRAVKSEGAAALTPAVQHAHWSALNNFLGYAIADRDCVHANERRVAYDDWRRSRASVASHDIPRVSVVVCVERIASDWHSSLRSVLAQDYCNLEVIVLAHGEAASALDTLVQAVAAIAPAARCLASTAGHPGALLHDAAEVATGDYINLLPAPHAFATTRIASCVRSIANTGASWGFSGVEFITTEESVAAGEHTGARRQREVQARIDEAGTIGFALIDQDCAAVDLGNLFLRRDFLRTLLPPDPEETLATWALCLHAVWQDEPVHLPQSLYIHRLADPDSTATADRMAFDRGVMRIFSAYYALACSDAVPPNPWAPSLAVWRCQLLKSATRNAHVLTLPLGWLQDFIARMVADDAVAATASAPGLSFVGFAYGEFGLAENMRALARACETDAIPFAIKDVDLRLRTRQSDRSMAAHVVDAVAHRVAVFCFNPDILGHLPHLLRHREDVLRRNVGYWFWELEDIPQPWLPTVHAVDEIWVATEFVRAAMQKVARCPVIRIPTPIEVRRSRPYTRQEFGLPESDFLFLFSFDFEPCPARKNPEGVVRAFQRAFGRDRRNVGLVIKSSNGRHQPARLAALRELIGDDPRIVLRDEILTRDQVYGLQSVADCYVSLHRSEGLGLGLAESMFQGKPVIGTAYSGNLDFMNEDNSGLVDFSMVSVAPGEYIYDDARFRWAEPDLEHAARQMQRMVADHAWREGIARRGMLELRSKFSAARSAALIRQRLQELDAL